MGLGASSGVCSIYLSILEVPFLSPDFVSSKILTVTIFEARRKIFISYFFQQTDLSVAEDGTMTITKSGNTTGISKIEYQSVAKKTHIYDLSGKELPQSNSSLHGIMIVKQGKITRKIIR